MNPRKAILVSLLLPLGVFFCLCFLASARSGKTKHTARPSLQSPAFAPVKWPPLDERYRSPSMITMIMRTRAFNVRIRGRAWILAQSYQVARLETDLAETIEPIRLRPDHQSVEYAPVRFPRSKVEIWLPASTELFMDFKGYRFYRRHTFTDFNLFSVKVNQQFGEIVER